MQIDSLPDMAVFARVVEAGSFSAAARQLGSTPSAVSPAYLASNGTPQQPRELAAHSCLYLGEDERDRHWRFRRGNESAEVAVRGRYVANHSEVLTCRFSSDHSFLKNGLGYRG